MSRVNCRHFDTCSAPLCPEMSVDDIVWYVGEPFCRRSNFAGLNYIKIQERLNKRNPSYLQGKPLRVFNLIAMFRERKPLTDEQKQNLLARLKKNVNRR